MKVNMQGLINRLNSLRERLNELFDKLEKLDDLEQEEMAIEDVEQHFQIDDTFNLAIATDVLEQADKLDKALEIIKEKPRTLFLVNTCENYDTYFALSQDIALIEDIYSPKEYDLLKEVLL